jgi:DnaJ-class molecular chaperone
MTQPKPCVICNGTGVTEWFAKPCPLCNGTGLEDEVEDAALPERKAPEGKENA